MSILMPALRRARDNGQTIVCAANEHSILLGLNLYFSDNNDAFPDTETSVACIGKMTQDVDSNSQVNTIWVCPAAKSLGNRMINPNMVGYGREKVWTYPYPYDEIYCHYGVNGLTDPETAPLGPKRMYNCKNPGKVAYVLDGNVYQLWSDNHTDNSRWRTEDRHSGKSVLNIGYIDGHGQKMAFPQELVPTPEGLEVRRGLFKTFAGRR